jgi:hypothetical protein
LLKTGLPSGWESWLWLGIHHRIVDAAFDYLVAGLAKMLLDLARRAYKNRLSAAR